MSAFEISKERGGGRFCICSAELDSSTEHPYSAASPGGDRGQATQDTYQRLKREVEGQSPAAASRCTHLLPSADISPRTTCIALSIPRVKMPENGNTVWTKKVQNHRGGGESVGSLGSGGKHYVGP